jgi:TPR repeat protein
MGRFIEAQRTLGESYRFGKLGLPVDLEMAKQYYYLAARENDVASKIALGKFVPFNAELRASDSDRMKWYNLAKGRSKDGFPELQLGRLEPRYGSRSKAAGYFKQSVKKGNAEAMSMLGLSYENGHGVKTDPVRAAQYYIASATHNIPDAFYNLGRAFENGIGVKESKDLAYAFYKHAETKFQHGEAKVALQRFDPLQITVVYDAQEELKQAARKYVVTPEIIPLIDRDFEHSTDKTGKK